MAHIMSYGLKLKGGYIGHCIIKVIKGDTRSLDLGLEMGLYPFELGVNGLRWGVRLPPKPHTRKA